MEKALLVFPYRVDNQIEFDRILDRFESRGYLIYSLDGIAETNFKPDSLPAIVARVKAEFPGLGEIAVLSNIKEMIVMWYRCYNSLITAFIFFLDDRPHQFTPAIDYGELYGCLGNFSGIDHEAVAGKIYCNLNYQNYASLISFLLQNSNYRFFAPLDHFDFDQAQPRNPLAKVYCYQQQEYTFGLGPDFPARLQKVSVDKAKLSTDKLDIDQTYLEKLSDYDYIKVYFVLFISAKSGLRQQPLIELLIAFFKKNGQLPAARKYRIYHEFLNYVTNVSESFPERIRILSFLAILDIKDDLYLKSLMKTLLDDGVNRRFHYPVLANTLFLITHEHKAVYDNYFGDRERVLKNIVAQYRVNFGKTVKSKPHTVAFCVDQLLSKLHAPTKSLFDYVLALKRYHPEYRIKVFVEDNFAGSPAENIMPFSYQSQPAREYRTEHLEYLQGENIGIFYSNPDQTREERTGALLNDLYEFNPEVIVLMGCDCSLSAACFHPDFPLVYFSLGGFFYPSFADIYLCADLDEVAASNRKYRVVPLDQAYKFTFWLDLPKPARQFERTEFGIAGADFVMVTVGNRLDTEMSREFIDLICGFLKCSADARWLIVGSKPLDYLQDNYQYLMERQQVKLLNYEPDLPGLYQICDVYLNPDRSGGGYSIAMAIDRGLPVVMLDKPSDGLWYVGTENAAGQTWEEYLAELTLLYNDQAYRLHKSHVLRERIMKFTPENSIAELVAFFELAQKNYSIRNAKKC